MESGAPRPTARLGRIGQQEEPVERAPNRPYDHGRFVIVEEPWPEG